MKFIHLADLHLGKTVDGFSLLEDQHHILNQIIGHIKAEIPHAVLISGDIYDKTVPSAGAVALLDSFLTTLSQMRIPVLMISGNHDSPERLAFAGSLLENAGVYLYSLFDGAIHTVTLADEHGPVDFHLLPFVRPAVVRGFLGEAAGESYTSALAAILAATPPLPNRRTVLLAHQFVTAGGAGPERSDSELEPVGSLNAVDATLFKNYCYTALGHIHGPQRIGADTIRYAGSPLKYSFSEHLHKKSVCMVELDADGNAEIRLLSLVPLRDMRKIRGSLAELTAPDVVESADPEDYLHITLTDEDVVDAIGRLRPVYPHVMELVFDNSRSRAEGAEALDNLPEDRPTEELFFEFYQAQNGAEPTKSQMDTVQSLLREAREA